MKLDAEKLDWQCCAWDELSTAQLHDALRLRCEIFIHEQGDPYCDIDGNDPHALHLLGYYKGTLIAYGRLILPGVKRAEAVLGRLCIAKEHRHGKIGTNVMLMLLKRLQDFAPDADVYGYTQTYWARGVLAMGAVPISSPMSKSRIEHIEVVIKADKIHELLAALPEGIKV